MSSAHTYRLSSSASSTPGPLIQTDTLADLYDPTVMPANLAAAHRAVDAYVDTLYRDEPFEDSFERVDLLLRLRRAKGRSRSRLAPGDTFSGLERDGMPRGGPSTYSCCNAA